MNFPKPTGRPVNSPAGRPAVNQNRERQGASMTSHFWERIERAGDRADSALGERRARMDRAAPGDARLIAALVLLNQQLPPIIDELTAGLFDKSEKAAFATVLSTLAGDLEPDRVVEPVTPSDQDPTRGMNDHGNS